MPFTVDPERFPDFPQMVKSLATDQFHLVVITDLHIAAQPGIGYAPYDSGVANDRFVKLPDGSRYVGTVWPGPSVFPEFTEVQTRDWWGSLYKKFVADGVTGFWNDMNHAAIVRSIFSQAQLTVEFQSRCSFKLVVFIHFARGHFIEVCPILLGKPSPTIAVLLVKRSLVVEAISWPTKVPSAP